MKYLKKFDEHSKYAQFIETDEFIKPNVSGCEFGDEVHYNDEEHDYSKDYLTFTVLEDGTFTLTIGSSVPSTYFEYVEYSIDAGNTWTKTDNIPNTTITVTTPTLSAGDEVLWRGKGSRTSYPGTSTATNQYSYFSSTCRCNVSGNVNTLLKLDTPNEMTSANDHMYKCLFREMTKLIDASKLLLPFATLNEYCYAYMFYGCTDLNSAPELLATKLSSYCYSFMFYGCTSLTKAPVLHVTTLPTSCYYNMFNGCSSLNYVKAHCVELGSNYSYDWLKGVAATGTFYKNPIATIEVGKSGIPDGWTIQDDTSIITEFNPQHSFTPAGYLTFTHTNDLFISLANRGILHTIYISKNGTNWHSLQETDVLKINSNENCYVCGDGAGCNSSQYTKFIVNGTFSISGNYNSLWKYSNIDIYLPAYGGFRTFEDCKGLTDASNLTLPTNTNQYCYNGMFRNCTSLIAPPSLPALSLSNYCYQEMFANCTSLVSAPNLPSESLAEGCYKGMFYRCTSLQTIPTTLPATTLAQFCYQQMFCGCSSITTAPTLPSTVTGSYSYDSMFRDCSSLTTAPNLLATTISNYAYKSMFSGCSSLVNPPIISATNALIYSFDYMFYNCTSLTTPPTINLTNFSIGNYCFNYTFYGCTSLTSANFINFADLTSIGKYAFYHTFDGCSSLTTVPSAIGNINTTLNDYCCNSMFANCSSLTTTPNLPSTTLAEACYAYMFNKCSSLTTVCELSNTTLATGCYYAMFKACTSLVSAQTILPATTAVGNCYREMFSGCKALVNPPIIKATNTASTCYTSMFESCIMLEEAPELVAETLTTSCYYMMFYLCSKLNYIKALFTTTPSTSYTQYWVTSVASTGIFVKNINATWTTTGTSGAPTNWTVIYFDPATEKYYLSDKTTECDDHGNVI